VVFLFVVVVILVVGVLFCVVVGDRVVVVCDLLIRWMVLIGVIENVLVESCLVIGCWFGIILILFVMGVLMVSELF